MTDPTAPGAEPDAADLPGAPDAPGDRAPFSLVRLLARWWPALLGLAIGVIGLIDLQPWRRADPPTVMPIGLALAYLVFGAVRGHLHRPGVLKVELVGLGVFVAGVLLALVVDSSAGQYVAAAAWIGHAAWDVAHHRDLSRFHAVGVVPRGWAEFCIVLDLLVGASLIAAPTI
jgi:hypothetical protein